MEDITTVVKHVGKLLETNGTCLYSRQLFHQLFRVGKLVFDACTIGKREFSNSSLSCEGRLRLRKHFSPRIERAVLSSCSLVYLQVQPSVGKGSVTYSVLADIFLSFSQCLDVGGDEESGSSEGSTTVV